MNFLRLSEICDISNGFAFKSKAYDKDGYARIIRIGNVQKGEIVDYDPKFYPKELLEELDKYEILENDILMSLTGNVGRVGRFPKSLLPAYLNQRVLRIGPKLNSKLQVDNNYLFYCLNSNKFERDAQLSANGVGQLNLSSVWVGEYKIPLPNLETQKAIAAKLDAADALRQKDQELLEHYDQLAQSIFIDMFGDPVLNEKGWEVRELNKVAPFHMSKHTPDVIKGKYWMLNLDAVEKNTGAILEKKMISTKSVSSSTYFFDETQVLYSKLRPYLNKVVIPFEKGVATTELVPLNPKKDLINRLFLATLLRSKSFVNYIEIKVSGAKMPRVDMNSLRTFKTILPPIHLQTQFAEKIKNIEAQKALVRQQAEQSEMLFQALLQESFNTPAASSHPS